MQSVIGAYFGEGFGRSDPIKSKKLVAKPKEKKIPCGCCSRLFATESNLEQHAKLQQGGCWKAYQEGLSGSKRFWKAAKAHMKAMLQGWVVVRDEDMVHCEGEDENEDLRVKKKERRKKKNSFCSL
jgi:hypothetical protein